MIEDMTVRKLRREDAKRLHPPRQELHNVPRPLAGHGDGGGSAPLPGASEREQRRAAADHERARSRRCASSSRSRSAGPRWRAISPSCASRASCRVVLSRRRWAPAGGGARRPQVQGGAQRRLRRRPARVRGRQPEGQRHRQQAHAAPRRAGQGPEGSQRHALAAAAGAAAGLVAAWRSRRRGCSRAAIRCCRSRRASSTGSCRDGAPTRRRSRSG